MQFFRMKRLITASAVALSLAVGTVGVGGTGAVREVLAQVNDTELDGIVEAMPEAGTVGTWQVAGTIVQVTEATQIDQEMGALAIGVAVEVEGETQPDGSILATEIEVEDNR